jgi:hypothetical protein
MKLRREEKSGRQYTTRTQTSKAPSILATAMIFYKY